MSSDLKVLVISFSFAPDGEIGAKRVTRFCSYLPELGIRPIVITVKERFLTLVDETFSPPPGVQIERTTVWPNPLQWYAGLKKYIIRPLARTDSSTLPVSGERRNSYLDLLRRHLLGLLNTPDQHMGWYFPAVKAAQRLIERESIAVMLSSGPPWTTHLVACHLRKKHRIPWAADFRDGWATSPMLYGAPRWERQVHARMEVSCLRRADLVICNTDHLRRSFVERNPLQPEKFTTITNGFDSLVAPPPLREARQQFARLFLHFGKIYGGRRIDTFCQAVSDLVNAGKLYRNSFKILFQGEVDDCSLAAVQQCCPELVRDRSIEFAPFDARRQAQGLMWLADLLLLFSGSPLEVPAKFYEYLKTGKPIFAVAERGALTELLDSTGSGIWADPADCEGIAVGLLRALALPSVPPEEAERRWASQFHFRSLTGQLAGWIRQLAARDRKGMSQSVSPM